MAELLLELFSEEIPARMQVPAADALLRALREGLAKRELKAADDDCRIVATPRRIGCLIRGLAAAEPRRTGRRRGPRVDAPEAAQAGFRRSLEGTAHRLEEIEEKKGRFVVAVVEEGGAPTGAVVREVLEAFLPRFPWPTSMRWGRGSARWVRPLQSVLCLFDGAVVPLRFAELDSGPVTRGHRFMAPAPFRVVDGEDYLARLHGAYVIAEPLRRRALIQAGAERLAQENGLQLRADPGLLDELAGLTEWPVPLLGRIDADFMQLPPEVLRTSMRAHQKYLTLEGPDGRLAPYFVVVANLEATDGGAAIVAGNERVLRARLADARFFWDHDRRLRLEERGEALARMVFHARLGSMADKAARLERLAGRLAHRLGTGDARMAARAGALAKTDLVTGMVGEFPELQGIMGAYYARAQGEAPPIAHAIGEHYAPQGPGGRCPTEPLAVVLSLADKLDSLVGLTAAGERATGSGDPMGLRRLALGIMRLVFDNGLRLPLREMVHDVLDGYASDRDLPPAQSVADQLMTFFAERVRVHLRGDGLGPDLIAAVFAAGGEDDLWRLREKVRAVAAFLSTPDGVDLLAAYRRACNIVRIETKKDGTEVGGAVAPDLLDAPAEIALHEALEAVAPRVAAAFETERFTDAMADLATLRQPVDRFFEDVLVNAEVPAVRINRLRLMARLGGLFDGIAVLDMVDEPRAAA